MISENWIPKSDTRDPDSGTADGRPVGAERDPDDARLALPDHGRPAGPGITPDSRLFGVSDTVLRTRQGVRHHSEDMTGCQTPF